MIVEHAPLQVIPHRTDEFEAAFADAESIISSMPGFVNLTLSRHFCEPFPVVSHFDPIENA